MDLRAHGIHSHIFTLLNVANAIRTLTGRPNDPHAYGAWEIGASEDLERCCLEFGQRGAFSTWSLPGGGFADAILEHYRKLGMKPVAASPLRFDKPAYVFVCKRG